MIGQDSTEMLGNTQLPGRFGCELSRYVYVYGRWSTGDQSIVRVGLLGL